MTVAWIDMPGAPLASKTEAVDFTTSRAVVAISVRYGTSRIEERAYRDGTWLYPYLGSSGPAGGAAGTYRLVRAGGWPSKPTVHVDEATDTFWDVLYEKDLTTLPTQSVQPTFASTYKTFTADGQPWFFLGSSGTLMISAGNGMILGAQGGSQSNAVTAGVFVGIKIWDMAGYDPAKATCVQVRFSGALSGLGAGDIGAFHFTRGDAWNSAVNNPLLCRYGQGRAHTFVDAGLATYGVSVPSYAGTDTTLDSFVLATAVMPFEPSPSYGERTNRRWKYGLLRRGVSDASMPSVESMMPLGSWSCADGIPQSSDYRMGAYLGSQPGTQVSVASRLTYIRVLQKVV